MRQQWIDVKARPSARKRESTLFLAFYVFMKPFTSFAGTRFPIFMKKEL
jgi:hypothetical protein